MFPFCGPPTMILNPYHTHNLTDPLLFQGLSLPKISFSLC